MYAEPLSEAAAHCIAKIAIGYSGKKMALACKWNAKSEAYNSHFKKCPTTDWGEELEKSKIEMNGDFSEPARQFLLSIIKVICVFELYHLSYESRGGFHVFNIIFFFLSFQFVCEWVIRFTFHLLSIFKPRNRFKFLSHCGFKSSIILIELRCVWEREWKMITTEWKRDNALERIASARRKED